LWDWWSGPWEHANVGAVVPDEVVVLDVDPRHHGDETLERLEAEHGILPATLTQHTGSGGLHLWLHVDNPDDCRQGAEVLGPGVDTRCAGRGFVLIAPSLHPCGGRYEWNRGPKAVADVPDWLAERLVKSHEAVSMLAPVVTMGGARYGRKALEHETARQARAGVGHRNQTLYGAAIRMGQLAAAGDLDLEQARAALAGVAYDLVRTRIQSSRTNPGRSSWSGRQLGRWVPHPMTAAHYAQAFMVTPGRCFRLVERPTAHGQPDHCSAPVAWHGTFTDRAGKRHQVDACDGHAGHLDTRRPASPRQAGSC
jgi:hypothetical protein